MVESLFHDSVDVVARCFNLFDGVEVYVRVAGISVQECDVGGDRLDVLAGQTNVSSDDAFVVLDAFFTLDEGVVRWESSQIRCTLFECICVSNAVFVQLHSDQRDSAARAPLQRWWQSIGQVPSLFDGPHHGAGGVVLLVWCGLLRGIVGRHVVRILAVLFSCVAVESGNAR